MKITVFSAQNYDKRFLEETNKLHHASHDFDIIYHRIPLNPDTTDLARGSEAVCVFVNDVLTASVLETLYSNGTRAILLRCAGFNNVDLQAAERLHMFVAHVPSYSPEAVAEFAVALIQTLNRDTHRAFNRIREGNFSLDGLLGHTLHGKTVGIVGTGKIGLALARIMRGFGCRLVAFDPYGSEAFKEYGEFVTLDSLLGQSDIISLHCPLLDSTRHIINQDSLSKMKDGAMLVNTSRGALIDTSAVVSALKSRKLGALALDVYEDEANLFYNDHSSDIIQDDIFQRLMTFPNVLVCGHQGFFTEEALREISEVTLNNLRDFVLDQPCRFSLVGKKPDQGADAPPVIRDDRLTAAPTSMQRPRTPVGKSRDE